MKVAPTINPFNEFRKGAASTAQYPKGEPFNLGKGCEHQTYKLQSNLSFHKTQSYKKFFSLAFA